MSVATQRAQEALDAIKSRISWLDTQIAELKAESQWGRLEYSEIVPRFGHAFFDELRHRDRGDAVCSAYFRDVTGRSPRTKSEGQLFSNALRRLEKVGAIELIRLGRQARWVIVLEP